MKKLHELLKLPQSAGDVGIEIEVEGENLKPILTDLWKTEDDGSLRGIYPYQRSEYVLQKPIPIRKVGEAVSILKEHQKDAVLNFSFRCSVHVHINVSKLTEPEFLAFLYLAILLEEPLMNMCGEERKGNRFCLRIADAEGYMNCLDKLFTGDVRNVNMFDAASLRYAAINIASVGRYGSLEFRGMRGTLDVEVIEAWCQSLYRLREVAKKLGDPVAVHDLFVKTDNQKFAKKCLGINANRFHIEECEMDINRSYSLTLDLPHSYKRFEEKRKLAPDVEEVIEKPRQGDIRYMINPNYQRVFDAHMENLRINPAQFIINPA